MIRYLKENNRVRWDGDLGLGRKASLADSQLFNGSPTPHATKYTSR